VNVFLAGATGAVGRRLSLLLLADGHAVTGTTRSRAKEAQLRSDGVTPVVVNVFDSQALRDAVVRAKPEIVIHQLTDLTGLLEPGRRDEVLTRNARLRIEGTANLVAAAIAARARRLIAQSIAFAYAALRFTEAYGLWNARTWAEWVAFVSGTLLLPLEVRQLFRGITFFRCALLVGNLAIVCYMLYIILENRRERRNSTTPSQ